MDGHPAGTGMPAGGQNPAYRPARHHHLVRWVEIPPDQVVHLSLVIVDCHALAVVTRPICGPRDP
jgi:hypothetical protein